MEIWHNFNGAIKKGTDLQLSLNNRALRYGDGFFESMRFEKGTCTLWDLHQERIFQSIELLGMVVQEGFYRLLKRQIQELLQKANLENSTARIRMQLYRKGAGRYAPEANDVGYLIEAAFLATPSIKGKKLGFAKAPVYGKPSYKGAKTLNALPYVLAARECREQKTDEIILYHENGNLIECSANNLWWIEDQVVCTVPLSTGCVNGVYRRYLVEEIPKQGIEVLEKHVTAEQLVRAREVFITNAVQGVQWVEELDGVFFTSQVAHYLIESL